MYKMIVVDDEYLARIGIKETIDWESHDITIVDTAVNGKDALEKIEKYSPDIIISDIKMPVMVGTEIALSATATDNYSENVTIAFEVTVNGTAVALTNNKFTPATAGMYAVKITATDEAGNVATETVSITVTAEQLPAKNNPKDFPLAQS